MVMINKFTETVADEPNVDMWVAHYDIGKNETVIMLGDTVLETEPGNMSVEMCEEIIDTSWLTVGKLPKYDGYIINGDNLKTAVIDEVSEQMDLTINEATKLIKDEDLDYITEKMFDAQSDAVWKLADRLQDEMGEEV